MLARRKLLRFGLAAVAASGLGLSSLARAQGGPPLPPAVSRKVALHILHTGEKLDVLYFDNGVYVPDALHAVNHVLRDFRTGDAHMIDPRLLDLLDAVSQRTGSHDPFEVICGYRSPKTNAMLHEHSEEVAAHSLHLQGQAIDIRLDDAALPHLHDAALRLGAGGVGYYPKSDFVHIDIGPVRRWQGT